VAARDAAHEVDAGAGESRGAIWGAGDGPSQDAAGHLFVETGNGTSSVPDLQESVVEFHVSQSNIPASNIPHRDGGRSKVPDETVPEKEESQ